MLFELRHYQCKPGTMAEQHEIYQRWGMQAQVRILGMPILFATDEVGALGSYTHVWAYEDMADRQRKRQALYADAGFQEYRQRFLATGNMTSMRNSLMTGVPFFPDIGRDRWAMSGSSE